MDKEKVKSGFGKIIGTIVFLVLVLNFVFNGYTYIMGRVHTVCGFDGAYLYEEDDATLVATFSGDEMVMYLWNRSGSTRTQYKYLGNYYNKGFGGKFLDNDDDWLKIPEADKAGEFYADCKSSVSTYWTGDISFMDEDEIDQASEENGVRYSRTYLFKIYGDTLTLITNDDGTVYIPMEKVVVLTGDYGETVEYLDYLWEKYV